MEILFDNCSQNDKNTLENIQYKALRLITGCKKGTSRQLLLEETRLAEISLEPGGSSNIKDIVAEHHTFVIPFSLQVHIYGTCYRPAYVAALKKLYLNAN